MTVYVRKAYDSVKNFYTLDGGPLDLEALGFSLPSLLINPTLVILFRDTNNIIVRVYLAVVR
jgi:hypothetical protein